MQGLPIKQLTPLQRIMLLICLVIAIFFLMPVLIALGGLFACYYGYTLYCENDLLNQVLGVLLIIGGALVFISFGFPYATPILGFIILDKLLQFMGYPSLWPLLKQLLESLVSSRSE